MKNKILSMLLSLFIALGLWLYVVTVVSPEHKETFYNIPVVFEGETVLTERGLMITSGENASVTLEISGNRLDLNKLNSSNITIKVDLSKIYDPGVHKLSYSDPTYPGDVASNAFTVESRSPETITITVEKKDSKDVPVSVNYTGAVADGFIADTENAVLDYPKVNIKGPSSVVELIDHARIDVDLTDQTESISENYRFTLCDVDGNPVDVEQIETNVAEVHLDVKIQRVQEIELAVAVNYGGGASDTTTQIDINPMTIRVSGSEALLEGLNGQLNLGTINLAEITEDTQLTFEIALPEGVTNLTGVAEATVDVRFLGLSTKEFTVESIKAINVPEGMECDLMAEVVTVKLRGPINQISSLADEDIVVIVDCADKEAGTATMKGTIAIEDETFSAVGMIGTCSVPVALTAKGAS